MKTVIGYRFHIKFDNGDTNEWFRETNIVSHVYPTKDVANKAFHLYLEKVERKIHKDSADYFKFQKKFEKDIKEFRNRCIRERDSEIERMQLLYRSKVSIIPEYLYDDATVDDDIVAFNIAD